MINYLLDFNFESHIRQNIQNNSTPINNNPCPDQLVGYLDKGSFHPGTTRENIDYLLTNNNYSINNSIQRKIVVILESPHTNEYDPITGQALGLALGKTGKLFAKHFSSALKKSKIFPALSSSNNKFAVVLINSVQYQCSLGRFLTLSKNKSLRNRNWRSCFNGGAKSNDLNLRKSNDLDLRLKALNPDYIINLCTKDLRSDVTDYISRSPVFSISSQNFTEGNHPASWWILNKRTIN